MDKNMRVDLYNEYQYLDIHMHSDIIQDCKFFNDIIGVNVLPNGHTICSAFKNGLVYDVTNNVLLKSYYITQHSIENSIQMNDVFHYSQSGNYSITKIESLLPKATYFYLGNSFYAHNLADLCFIVQFHHVNMDTHDTMECCNHADAYPFCKCSSDFSCPVIDRKDLTATPVTRVYMPVMEPLMNSDREKYKCKNIDEQSIESKFQHIYKMYKNSLDLVKIKRTCNMSVMFK